MSRRVHVFLPWVLLLLSVCAPSASAQLDADYRVQPPPIPSKIMLADTVAIDCDACPRDLAKAGEIGPQEILLWGRFRIIPDRRKADLILIFSSNQYMGDYLTRDGPDRRPVAIDGVILTVIDPATGAELWSDSRRWGSWRVIDATKALVAELRRDMELQLRRWTLAQVLQCSETPLYQSFAFLTPDEALDRKGLLVRRIENAPNRLAVIDPDAPDFCKRAQLVVGTDNKITGFEVVASQTDTLETAEVLEHADQFDLKGEKQSGSENVKLTARSKDNKILIEFDMQGSRSVFSRVVYSY